MRLPVHLLPLTQSISIADLERLPEIDDTREIVLCDAYLNGVEHMPAAEDVPGGFRVGRILNIDHHAPIPKMEQRVTSTTLAMRVLERGYVPPADALVVVNHADADSVLSAALMSGRIQPCGEVAEASVAADHTGMPNYLADALQAIEKQRDLSLSFETAECALARTMLPPEVHVALARRAASREQAARIVERGEFRAVGPVMWAELAKETDGSLFLPLLPNAVALMLVYPMPEAQERRCVKIRLGNGAPEGLSLHDLRLTEFDPAWGCRWNAGNNKRGGGTLISAAHYAATVAERVQAYMDRMPRLRTRPRI